MTGHLSEVGKALLGTGFCGAYTTFSTFSFESVRLLEDGRIVDAAGNVVMSVAVGLAAAAAGLAIGLATVKPASAARPETFNPDLGFAQPGRDEQGAGCIGEAGRPANVARRVR